MKSGTDDEIGDSFSIDACASLLTMLDERSYQRDLLRDANQLSERVLLPLALPWMHKGNPVTRNVPFDIDDMTEILMADDGRFSPHEHGPLGFGRFDIGQLRRGPINTRLATSADSWCTASRRSDDPGVMEVSSVVLPIYSSSASLLETNNTASQEESLDGEQTYNGDIIAPSTEDPVGEISLRFHEHTTKAKKRKITEVRSCVQRQMISVKVGSSSSRSSIFTDLKLDGKSRYGRLLEACLPAEIQNGRAMTTSKAQQIADCLGSYDVRHGLTSSSTAGKSSRTSCGRTRLIWTEKNGSDHPQRVFFSSSLTGLRIEGATQKRPRDIKLAIRVGGEILGASEESARDTTPLLGSIPTATSLSQSDELFDHPRAQCMLDDEEFTKNILTAGQDRSKGRGRSVGCQPVIDCLPDGTGMIGVICSTPGKMALASAHECLNQAAKLEGRKCTVCWTSDVDKNLIVRECDECGVLAHPQCCYDRGELFVVDETDIWRCTVCCFKLKQRTVAGKDSVAAIEQAKKSKRKTKLPQWLQDSHIDDPLTAGKSDNGLGENESHGIKCALCTYHGGAMSQVEVEGEPHWIHEVCRIWLKGRQSPAVTGTAECALCGKGRAPKSPNESTELSVNALSGYVLKCASSRCQIHFHPMCALVATALSECSPEWRSSVDHTENGQLLELSKLVDRRLCACYTLTALDVQVAVGARGKDPGAEKSLKLPIAFCGIHNPKREAAFRGLYPGGKFITADVMRIPAVLAD